MYQKHALSTLETCILPLKHITYTISWFQTALKTLKSKAKSKAKLVV